MECNKDEALRAVEIAESKVALSDYTGANRFALKAQNLYPELDGLPQFLATLDIHTSAEKGPDGKVDWYKVLGVEPSANEEMIQKKFRNLALILHPDKNKSAGAEGAFKILSQARKVLCVGKQIKSSMHDKVPGEKSPAPACHSGGQNVFNSNHSWMPTSHISGHNVSNNSQSSVPPSHNGQDNVSNNNHSSMPPSRYGFHNVPNNNHSQARDRRTGSRTNPLKKSRPPKDQKPTFWTICRSCMNYFQYLKMFLKSKLKCQMCHQAFMAYEVPSPKNTPISWTPEIQQQNSSQQTMPNSACAPGRIQTVATASGCGKPMYIPEWTQAAATGAGSSGDEEPIFSRGWTPALAKTERHSGIPGFGKSMLTPEWTYSAATDVKSSSFGRGIQMFDSGKTHASTDTIFSRMNPFQTGFSWQSANVESVQSTSSSSSQATGGNHPWMNIRHEDSIPNLEAHQWQYQQNRKPDTGTPNHFFSSVPNSAKPRKRRRQRPEMYSKVGMGSGGVSSLFGSSKFSFGTGRSNAAATHRFDHSNNLPYQNPWNILMGRAKKRLVKNVDKWSTPSAPKASDTKVVRGKLRKSTTEPGVKADITGGRVCMDTKDVPGKKSSAASSHGDSDTEEDNTKMSVIDPDFHDFDGDRTEKSFVSNQVWAMYSNDDLMPRKYVMVHSVISLKPFRIRISWLNSKTNHELAPLEWIDSKTCGNLWIGKHEVYKYLESFSHKVKWTKGARGIISIYPGKGDVWALYRNWSPEWDNETEKDVIRKYDMVQVLEDFNVDRGVTVVPLVKVAGFKTVFRQQWTISTASRIPRGEMFRFSHQVPYALLTGHEGQNAPRGCLELDPAATPSELLKVMEKTSGGPTRTEDEALAEKVEDSTEESVRVYVRKRLREAPVAEDAKRSKH